MAPPDIEALTDQLRAMYRTAWQQVLSELLVVQEDPARFRESRRLAEVQRRIETYMTQADQQAANWVNGTFPAIYAAGASVVGFTDFTQAMRDAMVVMGQGLFDDLLKATTGVRRSTKAFVRDVVGREAAQSVLTGETALGAAQRARQRLQSTVSAVTYKDGSKVGLDTYTDMALRTTTGIAYNKGRPREECEGYPLAHPNCRRSFGPRPDVRTKAEAEQAMATNTSAATRQQIEAAAQRQATADAAAQGRARPRRRITDERAIKLANREARLAARSVEHADEVAARVVGVAAPSVAPLTTTLENIAQSLDAEMVGLHHALKDAGSVATEKGLADKIARDLAANPSLRTPALAASKISDVVRFSMEGPAGGYTEMVRAALDELGADGYSVVKFKSFWGNDLYGAGINAQLATPEGQMFELQFHTPESSLAKKASHDPYETLRVLEKRVAAGELTVAEARAIAGPLEEQMRAIFAGLPIPPGAMDL
jgi:hypothetical protein